MMVQNITHENVDNLSGTVVVVVPFRIYKLHNKKTTMSIVKILFESLTRHA